MLISVKIVVADMSALTTIAGGLTPLDGRFLYGSQDIIEFAEALGKDGRAEYAAFQLGTDALAPPAFACFYLNMIYATIKFKWVRQTLTGVLFVYFVAVLITNNATPVVFLQYPSQPGIVGWLYSLLPVLDAMKYVLGHLTQWLGLVSCWLFSLGFICIKNRWCRNLYL